MRKSVIAIDGPSASGKGTLARKVAAHLNYAYLDTGLLYRATAYAVLDAGENPEDKASAIRAAKQIATAIATGKDDLLANPVLKEDHISLAASKIAPIPAVRDCLKRLQNDIIDNPPNGKVGAVLDGRDIGTVIAPNAPAKLFITATAEIRADRRFKELQSRGISVTYDTVLADLRERDARDEKRETAPSKAAEDAFIIDTSDLSPEDALEKALTFIKSRLD